jgi:hypothetical protein
MDRLPPHFPRRAVTFPVLVHFPTSHCPPVMQQFSSDRHVASLLAAGALGYVTGQTEGGGWKYTRQSGWP